MLNQLFLTKMKRLVLLCACLSVVTLVNAQTNKKSNEEKKPLRVVVAPNQDTLFVTNDKTSQLPQLVDEDGQTKYLIVEDGETIKKNLESSSFETTAKSKEELSYKLDFYKQKGFTIKDMYEKGNKYYISFEKK
jgi:hypothetical protein